MPSNRFPLHASRKMNGEAEGESYVFKMIKIPSYLFVDGNYLVEKKE